MTTSTYKQGHHHAVTANHKIRTAEADGAFLLPHLKPNFHILDIGCGPGSITAGFAKYIPNGSVTGVDLSEEVITQAKEYVSSLDGVPGNVSFCVGNVVDGLAFEDGEFDAVFCNQTLLHIPDPVKAMQEAKRVCKRGGLVACREGDWPFRFYPELTGLQLFHKYLWILVHGPPVPPSSYPDNVPHPLNHRSGSMIHVWARQAGFAHDRIVKKASVQVIATPEERKFKAGIMVARIEEGGHRAKFLEIGATHEEIDEIVKGWTEWERDVDGWYAIVNCEVVCWV